MRSYEIIHPGTLDGLHLGERQERALRWGEVRVAMSAASLNFRDLTVVKGRYPGGLPDRLVPLSDGAGRVEAIGEGVTRFSVGDRVMPIFKQGWVGGDPEPGHVLTALGGSIDGVLAERCTFDQQGLVAVPDHLSDEEAACLPCAAVTAWSALQETRTVKAGDTVLVLGTGGVALFALQFALTAGARVIVTSSSDDKIDKAIALGAMAGVNYRTYTDWGQRVRELTHGRGVDMVVETGGGGTLAQSIIASRTGGAISLVGVVTQGTIDPLTIMRSNLLVRGIGVGSRQAFEAMNRCIDAHRLRPIIDRTFDFEDAVAAYRWLEQAGHFGKVVIRIG